MSGPSTSAQSSSQRVLNMTERLGSKIFVGSLSRFQVDGSYIRYLNSDVAARQVILKDQSVIVESQDSEFKTYGRAHLKFLHKLRDEGIYDHYKMQMIDQDLSGICNRFLAQKMFLRETGDHDKTEVMRKLEMENSREVKEFSYLDKYLNFYTPPSSRILISKNITFNKLSPIPVYSDIEGETLENLNIPPACTFDYVERNVVDPETEPDLVKALKMAKEPQNKIRCNCRAQGIANCYENPKCPCSQLNHKMQTDFQVEKEGCELTKFNSFDPILFTHARDIFWRYLGFACSEECGCHGNCTNNTMFMIDRKLFPLEIYRNCPMMGFNIRSSVLIPAGTPIMEFTGELMDYENGPNTDYCYQSHYQNDAALQKLILQMKFTDSYKQLLMDFFKKDFIIDPAKFGNVGRTAAHSCTPNLEVVRVYQKSLSPAHVRLIMVSLQDIYPGTPLTIDYGSEYATRLNGICKCGTFACRQNHEDEELKDLSCLNLALVIRDIQDLRQRVFMKEVIGPIRK